MEFYAYGFVSESEVNMWKEGKLFFRYRNNDNVFFVDVGKAYIAVEPIYEIDLVVLDAKYPNRIMSMEEFIYEQNLL